MKIFLSDAGKAFRRVVRYKFRLATSPLRALPNFMIAGTEKGGTSLLFQTLGSHRQVRTSMIKEVEFFGNASQGTISQIHLDQLRYAQYFPLKYQLRKIAKNLNARVITGEASPGYLYSPEACKRIKNMVPDVKIIILLRDPIQRAYSKYFHAKRKGMETLTFTDAVRLEMQQRDPKTCVTADGSKKKKNYLGYGLYCEQLERYFKLFDRQQIHIVQSEFSSSNFQSAYSDILKFLEIEPDPSQVFHRVEKKQYPEIDKEVFRELKDFFSLPNKNLYELLGVDFGWQ